MKMFLTLCSLCITTIPSTAEAKGGPVIEYHEPSMLQMRAARLVHLKLLSCVAKVKKTRDILQGGSIYHDGGGLDADGSVTSRDIMQTCIAIVATSR